MILRFNIEPQQQERPRATGRGRFIRVYDPPKTAKFKRELKQLAVDKMQGKTKYEDAISVTIKFFRKVQKSISKKEHARRTQGHVRPIVKPDLDKLYQINIRRLKWRYMDGRCHYRRTKHKQVVCRRSKNRN